MQDFHTIYEVSLRDARRAAKAKLVANIKCYESLSNKDSQYAKIVKALGDLHAAAYNIYKNAPDSII